jgi:hypothetical protein
MRDTKQSRFRMTAVSSTLDQGFFRYQYRGEYDPYWSPDAAYKRPLISTALMIANVTS